MYSGSLPWYNIQPDDESSDRTPADSMQNAYLNPRHGLLSNPFLIQTLHPLVIHALHHSPHPPWSSWCPVEERNCKNCMFVDVFVANSTRRVSTRHYDRKYLQKYISLPIQVSYGWCYNFMEFLLTKYDQVRMIERKMKYWASLFYE